MCPRPGQPNLRVMMIALVAASWLVGGSPAFVPTWLQLGSWPLAVLLVGPFLARLGGHPVFPGPNENLAAPPAGHCAMVAQDCAEDVRLGSSLRCLGPDAILEAPPAVPCALAVPPGPPGPPLLLLELGGPWNPAAGPVVTVLSVLGRGHPVFSGPNEDLAAPPAGHCAMVAQDCAEDVHLGFSMRCLGLDAIFAAPPAVPCAVAVPPEPPGPPLLLLELDGPWDPAAGPVVTVLSVLGSVSTVLPAPRQWGGGTAVARSLLGRSAIPPLGWPGNRTACIPWMPPGKPVPIVLG